MKKLFVTMKPDFEVEFELFNPVNMLSYTEIDCKCMIIAKPVETVSVIGLTSKAE